MPTTPWKALDSVTGHVTLPLVWERLLGEYLPAFKILCLRQAEKLGGSIPCPNCECYHRIILRNDGTSAVAACQCTPAACPDFTVTIDQITPLEVNRHRLGRAIARALGCQTKITDLSPPATIQFGSWSSDSVPLILTLQTTHGAFRSVVAELLCLGRPYILFAPTDYFMDAACQQLVAHAKAGFFTVDATLRLTQQGTLEAPKPAPELFAAFTPESERPKHSALCTPRYALRKGLRVWELYFDYERALLKHERGIFYVHWLLYHPDETPIHAIDLMAKVPEIYRQQLGLAPLVNPATGRPVELESHARLQERSLALDDRQAMRAIFKKEKELEAILDSDDATEPEKAEALRELEEIIEYEKNHARRSRDAAHNLTDSVQTAIRRLRRHISQGAEARTPAHNLLLHIKKHMPAKPNHMPGTFCYAPPPWVNWTS